MRIPYLGLVMMTFLTASAGAASAEGTKEGDWEITMQMTIPGMPVAIPPVTIHQCITEKDRVPRPQPQQGKCEISTVKSESNKVSWSVKCTGQRPMEGHGEVTYSGDTMQGQSTFQMKNPRTGQDMTATQTINGKRTGDCKK